jgi:hypothetical protein
MVGQLLNNEVEGIREEVVTVKQEHSPGICVED